eukprot:GHVS01014744.1.p2 GENE.GHVS01014744.1~~GHVS01014744.1.p2  ORF type:complete len:195 (+),score=72.35 GHVS01014744.1:339-923(+)
MVGEVVYNKLTKKKSQRTVDNNGNDDVKEEGEEKEANVEDESTLGVAAVDDRPAAAAGSEEGGTCSPPPPPHHSGHWGEIVCGATARSPIDDGQHCIELWLNDIEHTTATVLGKALEELLVPIAYPMDGMMFEPFVRSASSSFTSFRLTTELAKQPRPTADERVLCTTTATSQGGAGEENESSGIIAKEEFYVL